MHNSGGSRGGAPGAPPPSPLFLDQTEALPPLYLPGGLDPPLHKLEYLCDCLYLSHLFVYSSKRTQRKHYVSVRLNPINDPYWHAIRHCEVYSFIVCNIFTRDVNLM